MVQAIFPLFKNFTKFRVTYSMGRPYEGQSNPSSAFIPIFSSRSRQFIHIYLQESALHLDKIVFFSWASEQGWAEVGPIGLWAHLTHQAQCIVNIKLHIFQLRKFLLSHLMVQPSVFSLALPFIHFQVNSITSSGVFILSLCLWRWVTGPDLLQLCVLLLFMNIMVLTSLSSSDGGRTGPGTN